MKYLLLGFYCLVFVPNRSMCQEQSKFSISENEFVSMYINKKYKSNVNNKLACPDSTMFLYKGISQTSSEYSNSFLHLKPLNQKQIVNWILPMFKKSGFNDDFTDGIDYQFLSSIKNSKNYSSFIIRLRTSITSDNTMELYLINTNKEGVLIDGLLLYRDIIGMHIYNDDYPVLKCNPMNAGPPYIQNISRRTQLQNDSIVVYENCKILKKDYEALPQNEQIKTVLLRSIYTTDSLGFIRELKGKKIVEINTSH